MSEKITVVIDGKSVGSFNDSLERWKHEEFLRCPRQLPLQTKIEEEPSMPPPIKDKKLKIYGRIHDQHMMELTIFCYDYIVPTKKQLEEDFYKYQTEKNLLDAEQSQDVVKH